MTRQIAIVFFLSLILMLSLGCKKTQKKNPENGIPENQINKIEDTLYTSLISPEYILGKFDPATHPSFTKVDPNFADESGYYLHKDAYEAFIEMKAAADRDNIELIIISATRPFTRQKKIWEAKWNGQRLVGGKKLTESHPNPLDRALKILEYSSMPGTSRHHWGSDFDLNALENSYFESGRGAKEYQWLISNAPSFGFCQVYTKKGELRPTGYEEEKWHWSYVPLSSKITSVADTLLSNDLIAGFDGAETAVEIDIVKNYILGINPDCH